MSGLIIKIEDTREELNKLIESKDIITGDEELLKLSIKLDELIAQYYIKNK